MLMGNFASGIQHGDEIGAGELAAGVLLIVNAEEHREVLYVARLPRNKVQPASSGNFAR